MTAMHLLPQLVHRHMEAAHARIGNAIACLGLQALHGVCTAAAHLLPQLVHARAQAARADTGHAMRV